MDRLDLLDLRLIDPTSDISADLAALRFDIRERDTLLRQELDALHARLRAEAEARHDEVLKWLVMFWIAQAAATAVLVSGLSTVTS
jgi:hypothetical protein